MKLSFTPSAAIACVALVLALPAPALAAETLPDAIDDPIAAIAPVEEQAEIAAIEPDAPEAAPAAAVAPISSAPARSVALTPAATARSSATAAPVIDAPMATGSLPFTGVDSSQLVLLLIVGLVLVTGGLTARLAGRPAPIRC